MNTQNRNLDPRLAPIYEFLEEYMALNGYAPSLREIGDHCHLDHTTAMRYLDKLEAKGLLVRTSKRARSIILLAESG